METSPAAPGTRPACAREAQGEPAMTQIEVQAGAAKWSGEAVGTTESICCHRAAAAGTSVAVKKAASALELRSEDRSAVPAVE